MGTNKTPLRMTLSAAERDELERLARGLRAPHRAVVRAQTILSLAAGTPLAVVARTVGRQRNRTKETVMKRSTMTCLMATGLALATLGVASAHMGGRGFGRPPGGGLGGPGGGGRPAPILMQLVFPCRSACGETARSCAEAADATAVTCIGEACATEVSAAQTACASDASATACRTALDTLRTCGTTCLDTRSTAFDACRTTLTTCASACTAQ